MNFSGILRHTGLSGMKVGFVANQIRGLGVYKALIILQFSVKKAALLIKKLLISILANVKNNHNYNADNLKIVSIYVNKARYTRRFNTAAKGRIVKIVRRSCHISIELG